MKKFTTPKWIFRSQLESRVSPRCAGRKVARSHCALRATTEIEWRTDRNQSNNFCFALNFYGFLHWTIYGEFLLWNWNWLLSDVWECVVHQWHVRIFLMTSGCKINILFIATMAPQSSWLLFFCKFSSLAKFNSILFVLAFLNSEMNKWSLYCNNM